MACTAQYMLSASECIFLGSSKPQVSLVRGAVIGGVSGSGPFLLTCSASLSLSPSSPAPAQEDSDCNEEECARRRRDRLLPALAPLLSIPSDPSSLVAKGERRGGQAAANENMRCAIHSCCAHAGRDRARAAAGGGVDSRRAACGYGRVRRAAAWTRSVRVRLFFIYF